MEERVYHDRGFITAECRLLSRERNVRTLLADAFGSVLNRPVEVTVSADEVGLHYTGADLRVGSQNGAGVYGNEDRRIIFWHNGSQYYEAVFAREGHADRHPRSIAPYFGADVASPEKSEAEIAAWRGTPPPATRAEQADEADARPIPR